MNPEKEPEALQTVLQGLSLKGDSSSQKPSTSPERTLPGNVSMAEWKGVRPALRTVLKDAVANGEWPVLLHGPPGTGKSCASACVYRDWEYPVARWYRLEQFVRDITACRRHGSVSMDVNGRSIDRTERVLWQFAESDQELWCIDDFGTRQVTETAFDIVFELIDRRSSRPTIVTSNLCLQELSELFDRRIADRLASGTVVEVTGKSRRKGKRVRV